MTEQLMEGIRRLLGEEIERQGRSVRNVAAAAEIDPPSLRRFLAGTHDTMRASSLFSLAYAMGKTPAWLIREGGKLRTAKP